MNIFLRTAIIISMLLSAFFTGATAKGKNKAPATIYAFGYSTCLNDSTVYLTAVTTIPGASLEKKTHFLSERGAYTNQLKTYIESKYTRHQTSVVFFSTSRKEVEGKYVSMRRRLQKSKSQKLVELPTNAFAFAPLAETTAE